MRLTKPLQQTSKFSPITIPPQHTPNLSHLVLKERERESEWIKRGNPKRPPALGFSSSKTTEASRKEEAGTPCRWAWGRGVCGGRRLMEEEEEVCRCREGRLGS